MKYYFLEKEYFQGDIQIETINIPEDIKDKILNGEKVKNLNDVKIEFKNPSRTLVDFPIGGTSLPIISDRFKQIITREHINNSSFIKLHHEHENKFTYWLLLLENNIECFDWNQSEYTQYNDIKELEKIPETVDKLVIDESKTLNKKIFRIAEIPINIFINETLKKILDDNKLTGLIINSIDEYEKW